MKLCPACQSPCFDADRRCSACGELFSSGEEDVSAPASALAVTERTPEEGLAPDAEPGEEALGEVRTESLAGAADSGSADEEEETDEWTFEPLDESAGQPRAPEPPPSVGQEIGSAVHGLSASLSQLSREMNQAASDRHVNRANRKGWRKWLKASADPEYIPRQATLEWTAMQKELAQKALREDPTKMNALLAGMLFSNWTPFVLFFLVMGTLFGMCFFVWNEPWPKSLAAAVMVSMMVPLFWFGGRPNIIRSIFGIGNQSVRKGLREKEKAEEMEK